MDCCWVKISPSLQKGIAVINELEDMKFEQYLRRIVAKMKAQDTEIFTEDERHKLEKIFKVDEENLLMATKTVLYLFKRLLKYIFMPSDMKKDLNKIGLSSEKADVFVKVWSAETRTALDELSAESIDNFADTMRLSWKLNAEVSSDYCKKSKIPKAYLSFSGEQNRTEMELNHQELYSIFLQFESIQNDLDNIFLYGT